MFAVGSRDSQENMAIEVRYFRDNLGGIRGVQVADATDARMLFKDLPPI